ncbi:hypothetical protein ACEWY4_002751 [Coilia grayii]|uniref:UPAR/Ly6 domain-containing protein n=1 Tax=Coilia grayii TaxID=363190 RepID=A0ABD1KP90_9TELE
MCVVGQTPEKCFECSGKTWDSCKGSEHTCRVSEKCLAADSEFSQVLARLDGKREYQKKVGRRCADASLCEKDMSVNFRLARWRIKTNCDTNATLGNEKVSKGSLKCYGCISIPSECTKTVECSETETMCIKASEVVGGNLVVSKGCATETMCRLRREISDVTGPVVVGDVSCCQGDFCNSSDILKSISSACLLLLSMLPWMLS